MDFETLSGWPGVLACVIVVACIASIFGFEVRWPGASRTQAAGPAARRAERVSGQGRETPREGFAAARPEFREAAEEKLLPLLRALMDRARAHRFEARIEAAGEGQATSYRLEVRRPDHPTGQPTPYITFSAGEEGLVDVIYGGMFPGPSDHNGQDTEISWRTVRWDQVDNVLATFAHKVFARFE